jgi:hypothetical protein
VNKNKRHQNDTKSFEELTFSEQAKSINIRAVWFLDATRSHVRKCVDEHGPARAKSVPAKVAHQLRSIADQVEELETPRVTEVPVKMPSE